MADPLNPLGLSSFRKNTDYRDSQAWKELVKKSPAIAEACITHATEWIGQHVLDGSAPDQPAERLYEAVLKSQGIRVHSDHPHAYTNAFQTLRALSDAIKSNLIEIPDRSKIHAAVGELHTSEAHTVLELRNAAVQEAMARILQERGTALGR